MFNRPHPFIFNKYSILVPSLVSFLLIVFLAPFEFQNLAIQRRILVGLGISSVVAISILLTVTILKRAFPNQKLEDQWTIGKEFLLILFVVTLIIFFMSVVLLMLQPHTSYLTVMLKTVSITLAVSIFPILILILFEQFRHQKLQLQKAQELTDNLKKQNTALAKQRQSQPEEQSLLLKSETGEVELQLSAKELIYLKSDGNYLEVYYQNAQQIEKKLIRNRLKNIEAVLPSITFLRCHNRYIVNGNSIVKVEGNARSLLLFLKDIPDSIPVSRAKAKTISNFLESLRE